MGFESRGPGRWGGGQVLRCGRHGAEEGMETEDWCRSYDGFVESSMERVK